MQVSKFNSKFKPLVVISLLLFVKSVWGAQDPPNNCLNTEYKYEAGQLILSPEIGEEIQRLYLVRNNSPNTLVLSHTNEDYLISLGWKSTIDRDHWSAFGVDEPGFAIDCLRKESDDTIPVACEEVVEVCYLPNTRFALSSLGSFWLSENKQLNQVLVETRRKGVKLLKTRKR